MRSSGDNGACFAESLVIEVRRLAEFRKQLLFILFITSDTSAILIFAVALTPQISLPFHPHEVVRSNLLRGKGRSHKGPVPKLDGGIGENLY